MKKTNDKLRVVIAVTESSSLPALWRAAMKLMSESPAELMAVFLDDDRWRRAASLPFTREISRIGGTVANFTVRRAEQVNKDAITQMRHRIEQLASKADLGLEFEVLPESDQKRIKELVGTGQNVLVAPSFITTRPIYARLTRLDCRILLIETTEENQQNHRADGPEKTKQAYLR
jgi:hypothetical protein